MEVCSKTTCLGAAAGNYFYRLQFGGARGAADLQHELFPLHSPLLRESWLVSFPPLSNMLKSSGSSYLIGGPKGIGGSFRRDTNEVNTLHRDCLRVIEAPTQSSDLHRRLFTSGGLPAQRQQGSPQSAAPHSSAGAKRRTSARGGEWGEQTLQQACSQAYPGSAMCVQNFDDSLNSAIRITYRISLRSSSLREPRYPLLKVVSHWYQRGGGRLVKNNLNTTSGFRCCWFRCLIRGVNCIKGRRPTCRHAKRPTSYSPQSTISWIGVVMILPQVHLRKPCYDFTFL